MVFDLQGIIKFLHKKDLSLSNYQRYRIPHSLNPSTRHSNKALFGNGTDPQMLLGTNATDLSPAVGSVRCTVTFFISELEDVLTESSDDHVRCCWWSGNPAYKKSWVCYPIGSMYGIFTHIWLKYTIHGASGYGLLVWKEQSFFTICDKFLCIRGGS